MLLSALLVGKNASQLTGGVHSNFVAAVEHPNHVILSRAFLYI